MNWLNNETLGGFGLRLIWSIMKISEGERYSGASSFTWYSTMFLSLILFRGLTDRDCFIFRCGPIQDGRHLKPSQDTSRRLVAWMFHQVCSSSIYVSERLWTRLSGNSTRLRVISLSFYLSCDDGLILITWDVGEYSRQWLCHIMPTAIVDYPLYSLSVFSLAKSLQLLLDISATNRLVNYLLADSVEANL